MFSCLTSAGAAGNFRVKCAKEKCPSVASRGRPSYQIYIYIHIMIYIYLFIVILYVYIYLYIYKPNYRY